MANFQLNIPKPCAEKVDKMVKTTAGAFCSSCQKEVIDFSQMTDQEITQYFLKAKGGICGHFREKQLEHTYKDTASILTRWPRYLLAALVSMGLPGLAYAQNASKARPSITQSQPEIRQIRLGQVQKQALPKDTLDKFEGRVIDAGSGEPLPGVAVRLLHTQKGTVSDMEGYFALDKSTSDTISTNDSISLSFIGFKSMIVSIDQLQKNPVVALHEDMVMLGETIVIAGSVRMYSSWSPRGLWWKIRNIFRNSK